MEINIKMYNLNFYKNIILYFYLNILNCILCIILKLLFKNTIFLYIILISMIIITQ